MVKALIALLVVLVLLIGWAAVVEERKWREFAAEHNCRVVGKRQSEATTGYTQTAYLCDDGVTYWRNH